VSVEVVDYHTGGEPFRIVTGGVPPLEGTTVLERRRFARERVDHVRRLLVFEPRGHASRSPPDRPARGRPWRGSHRPESCGPAQA
jgi:proline racemase